MYKVNTLWMKKQVIAYLIYRMTKLLSKNNFVRS